LNLHNKQPEITASSSSSIIFFNSFLLSTQPHTLSVLSYNDALTSNILLKLLQPICSTAYIIVGDHHSSLLQVIDFVPANMLPFSLSNISSMVSELVRSSKGIWERWKYIWTTNIQKRKKWRFNIMEPNKWIETLHKKEIEKT